APPAPRSRRRHHCTIDNASAVSSTSLIPAWNALATRLSNASVTVTGSVSVSPPAAPITSRAGSSEPSTSKSEGSLSIPVQKERRPHTPPPAPTRPNPPRQPTNRGPPRGHPSHPPRPNPPPPPPKLSHQDAPRPPPPRKVMAHQNQTPRLRRTGIEPNRLQQ